MKATLVLSLTLNIVMILLLILSRIENNRLLGELIAEGVEKEWRKNFPGERTY